MTRGLSLKCAGIHFPRIPLFLILLFAAYRFCHQRNLLFSWKAQKRKSYAMNHVYTESSEPQALFPEDF